MARYSCNYTAPSTGVSSVTTGTFCGAFYGCTYGDVYNCNSYCVGTSGNYRDDNYVTLFSCSNWSYSSDVTCFVQNMADFDEVYFSVGFCSCCTSFISSHLHVLNCCTRIHSSSSSGIVSYYYFTCDACGTTCRCCCSIGACSYGRSSFNGYFYPIYTAEASCNSPAIGFVMNSMPYASGYGSQTMHGLTRGIVFPCLFDGASNCGWADWSRFNGFGLCSGCLASGTGCYCIRARIRRT